MAERKRGREWLISPVLVLSLLLCGSTTAKAGQADGSSPAVGPAGTSIPAARVASSGHDKGLFLRSEDERFLLKASARLQVLYQLACRDSGSVDCLESFSLPRAQAGLSGHAWSKSLSYVLAVELGHGFAYLRDYYLDAALLPGSLQLRAGQWKRPYSRQQITSDGKLEMVDRSLVNSFSGAERDIGLALHDGYERSPELEWVVGLFNGTGAKPWFEGAVATDPQTGEQSIAHGKWTNVPERFLPAVVLRLGYNHGGIAGYEEADLEGGPLRFAVAASGWVELDADKDEAAAARAEVDFLVKAHGFSSTGELHLLAERPGNGLTGMDFTGFACFAQAGYLFGGHYQPTIRYTLLKPDRENTQENQVAMGFSIYLAKHDIKWQIDAARSTKKEGKVLSDHYLARTQLQFGF